MAALMFRRVCCDEPLAISSHYLFARATADNDSAETGQQDARI